jgi:ribosome biogenesis GTPase
VTRLESFGWRSAPSPGVARVVSSHGDYYHLVADEAEGEIVARKKKSAFLDRSAVRPITGDFVSFKYNPAGESMITGVLPRFSRFERSDPTARRKAQTLAVNFDTLFIMMSMNENFSLPRLERFLFLAEDIGDAEAVVVLTKSDLATGGRERFAVPDGVKSISISSRTGEGMDELKRYIVPARTVAFIGSSGVGKSTLVNTLAGEEWCAVQEIQEWSGKGRHTTTSRELIMLPCGAMVVDTPGIREIGMIGETEDVLVKGESSHRYRK